MPHYFDAHQHFHFEALTPHRAAVDADLHAAGLRRAVVNGTCEEEWPAVAALARQYDWILPSYGVHPWDCGNRSPDWLKNLRAVLEGSTKEQAGLPAEALAKAGVGEIGLDRWIIDGVRPDDPRIAGLRVAPMDEQCEVFAEQLKLAAEFNRAASIHCTQAFGVLHDVLRSTQLPARGFLLHGYGGPVELIETFAGLGAYFSFNLEALQPRLAARLENFKKVPADRLLVETDAPAKAPPPERNRFPLGSPADGSPINHPANIMAAYDALAGLRGLPLETVAAQVEENFARLFL
jgi:TatD DNase family protein